MSRRSKTVCQEIVTSKAKTRITSLSEISYVATPNMRVAGKGVGRSCRTAPKTRHDGADPIVLPISF